MSSRGDAVQKIGGDLALHELRQIRCAAKEVCSKMATATRESWKSPKKVVGL